MESGRGGGCGREAVEGRLWQAWLWKGRLWKGPWKGVGGTLSMRWRAAGSERAAGGATSSQAFSPPLSRGHGCRAEGEASGVQLERHREAIERLSGGDLEAIGSRAPACRCGCIRSVRRGCGERRRTDRQWWRRAS